MNRAALLLEGRRRDSIHADRSWIAPVARLCCAVGLPRVRGVLGVGPLQQALIHHFAQVSLDELAGAVAEAAGVTDISAMRDTIPKAGVLFDALELIDLEKAARGEFAGATSVDPVTEIA